MIESTLTDTQACILHLAAIDRALEAFASVVATAKTRRYICAEDATTKLYNKLDGLAPLEMRRWNSSLDEEQGQQAIAECTARKKYAGWDTARCELYAIVDGADSLCPTCKAAKAIYDAKEAAWNAN